MSLSSSVEFEFLHLLSDDFPEFKISSLLCKKYALSSSKIKNGDDAYMFFLDEMTKRVSSCLDGKTIYLILENNDPEKCERGENFLQVICSSFSTKEELQQIYESVGKNLENLCNEIKAENTKTTKMRF